MIHGPYNIKFMWMNFVFIDSCLTSENLMFRNFLNYENERLNILRTKDAESCNAILVWSALWHPVHCQIVPAISWSHRAHTHVASHMVRVQLTDFTFSWPVHAKHVRVRCAWCGIFTAFSLLFHTYYTVNNATNWESVTIFATHLHLLFTTWNLLTDVKQCLST